jgi:hypothetical protein
MTRKITIGIVIVLVAILCLFLAYASDISFNGGEQRTLKVSSEGPIKLPQLVDEIRTHGYYRGYDNETVKWMESLGDKCVWVSSDEFVIMNKWDSNKIPSQYVCDAYFNEIFSCDVLEKHSLGSGKNSKDVLLVKNVQYIGEEIHYCDV